MKWLNDYKLIVVFVGFVAAIVLNGGRAKADFTFGEPTNLGATINSPARDSSPVISADGLTLFFQSHRAGGYGSSDLWAATRNATDAPWGAPTNLGPTVNSAALDSTPYISADGLELYFECDRPSGFGSNDMWVTTRVSTSDPWGEPVNLGPTINTSAWDFGPNISADGLTLFFSSGKPGGVGGHDMYVTTRAKTSDAWKEPMNIGSIVNSSGDERCPNLSADGFAIRFHSNRAGGYGSWDIWQAPILPVVDLNGDGIVDSADMSIMVDHWGENYALCDIGPTPLGDGTVDVQDLVVLAEHLFEDYRLIAHWKLDEQADNTAYDSVSEYNAILEGQPVWQPTSGQVGGALEFDGIDDYVYSFRKRNGQFGSENDPIMPMIQLTTL